MRDEESSERQQDSGGESDGRGHEVGAGEEIPPEVFAVHSRYGSEMITILEPEGVPRYESPAIRRTLGYKPIEHFEGDPSGGGWTEMIHPDDVAKVSESVIRSISEPGESPPVEYRIKDAAGEWRWFELRGTNLTGDPGIRGIVVSTREVTDRKRAEEALRRSEERFRTVVQNAAEIVKIVDPDGTLRYASPAYARVMGYDPEESTGTNVLDNVHSEDLPEVRRETERALKATDASSGPVTSHAEYRYRHADGSWRHVESVSTYLQEDPAVSGVVVNVRDVTERKEAEREARNALQRFEHVFRHSALGMCLISPVGSWIEANDALCAILGYTEEELREKTFTELTHPDDLATDAVYGRILLSGEQQKVEMEKRFFSVEERVVSGSLW